MSWLALGHFGKKLKIDLTNGWWSILEKYAHIDMRVRGCGAGLISISHSYDRLFLSSLGQSSGNPRLVG